MPITFGGSSGPPGLSAYDTAVRNGFVGTEAEWLASLQGDSGSNVDALLAHDPVDSTTYSVSRTDGLVTRETWTRVSPLTLLKSIDYTRTGGVLSQEVHKVFDVDGVTVLGQMTITYSYVAGVTVGIIQTRDI